MTEYLNMCDILPQRFAVPKGSRRPISSVRNLKMRHVRFHELELISALAQTDYVACIVRQVYLFIIWQLQTKREARFTF